MIGLILEAMSLAITLGVVGLFIGWAIDAFRL